MTRIAPILALLLALASPAPAGPPAPAAPAAAPSTRTETLAKEVAELLRKGDLDAVAARFSPQMAVALPKERFREVWNGLPTQLGALKSLGAPAVRGDGERESAWVPVEFEKAAVSILLAFDAEGRLAGLRIVPGGPPSPWSPAAYADPARAREREVTVGSGEWALPGTLTLPAGTPGPFPAVVLVHGSGPNDRDETVGGTKAFRDLAGGLASRGVAVLRYEKRTRVHGARMKSLEVGLKEEVVDDALAALALLRAEPGVDARRVALLGHSLGGMLAPRIAGLDPRTAGIVVMAGNTRPPEELVADQMEHLVSVGAATGEQATAVKADVARLRALKPDSPEAKTATLLGAPASYWLAFRGYDPAETAKGLAVPVLVLQGGRDYQVTAKDLDGWKAAVGRTPRATIRLFPKLNHLFVAGEGPSTPAEYEKPGHVAPEVIDAIAAWALALPPRAAP